MIFLIESLTLIKVPLVAQNNTLSKKKQDGYKTLALNHNFFCKVKNFLK